MLQETNGDLRAVRVPIALLKTLDSKGRASENRDVPSVLFNVIPSNVVRGARVVVSAPLSISVLLLFVFQAAFMELEKPASIMGLIGGPETGLQWDKSGLVGVIPPFKPTATDTSSSSIESTSTAASVASSTSTKPWEAVTATGCVVPLSEVTPYLSSSENGLLRRWAVLTHVLSGKAVPAAAVRALLRTTSTSDGEMPLHRMRDEVRESGVAAVLMLYKLGPSSSVHMCTDLRLWNPSTSVLYLQLEGAANNSKASRIAELLHWHPATDAAGVRYWWHDVTWHRQWEQPMLDGRTPDEARAEVQDHASQQ